MRVLAHIHTRNDERVIDQLIDALLRQTRQPDHILIVDNASTDDTLNRVFPPQVTVIRNKENLGTSGTVRTGFQYALEHEYNWIWVFDADTVPQSDVLERLLNFYDDLQTSDQQHVCFLACWPISVAGEIKEPPIAFTNQGILYLSERGDCRYTACDCTLWSGSLYRTASIAKIGLPSPNYVLDVAEMEYGYRAHRLGYISYIVHQAVMYHDVGRPPGAAAWPYRFGPFTFTLYELPPTRCYYAVRNWIYFWVYQYKPLSISCAVRSIVRSLALAITFAIRPVSHRKQLLACLQGIYDGLGMRMERRR
jgi:rhamnosyltransferase